MNLEEIIDSEVALSAQQIPTVQERLQLALDQRTELETRTQKLGEEITLCRSALSPVRILPREILQEIFLHCLPTEHNALMNASEPPLLLSRVCRRWRITAMSTPAFWASLHIDLWPPHDAGYFPASARRDALIDNIETWLQRARAVPLSISFLQLDTPVYSAVGNGRIIDDGFGLLADEDGSYSGRDDDSEGSEEDDSSRNRYGNSANDDEENFSLEARGEDPALRTMKILTKFCKTWQNISLAVRLAVLRDSPLPSLNAADFPMLQSFKCVPPFSQGCDDVSVLFTGLFSSPALRELDMPTPLNPTRAGAESCVPSQITILTLGGIDGTPGAISQILSRCANLEEFRLTFGIDGPNLEEIVPMSLPKLRALSVARDDFYWDSSLHEQFFDNLHTPQLASFSCQAEERPPYEDPPWAAYLIRSKDVIESLHIAVQPVALGSGQLPSFLKGNDTIKHLRLSARKKYTRQRNDEQCLEFLFPDKKDPPKTVCPTLESLELVHWADVSDDSLVEILKIRAGYTPDDQPPRLRKVTVHLERERGRDIAAELPAGLIFDIQYDPLESPSLTATESPVERWKKYIEWRPL